MFIETVIFFVLGLIIGSFLTALTDRWPKDIPLNKGRSKCPNCKKQIEWYDNIPLISYLLIGGKCRNCKKSISIRYPLIEFSTASLFALATVRYTQIEQNLSWLNLLPDYLGIAIVLIIVSILIAVFVIDFENQYIPDRLTFWGLGIVITVLLFTNNQALFPLLLNGMLASLFLLLLHLVTFGKGMGLGDVKLAIFMGTIFSYQLALLWLFLSFVIGSIVGLAMIALGVAKVKQQIPFGPFLVSAALLVIFCGSRIINIALPYI